MQQRKWFSKNEWLKLRLNSPSASSSAKSLETDIETSSKESEVDTNDEEEWKIGNKTQKENKGNANDIANISRSIWQAWRF